MNKCLLLFADILQIGYPGTIGSSKGRETHRPHNPAAGEMQRLFSATQTQHFESGSLISFQVEPRRMTVLKFRKKVFSGV